MAHKKQPLHLTPVDDAHNPQPQPIRLDNWETRHQDHVDRPIRLGPGKQEAAESQRLDLPSRDDAELRAHQPGIETIIESSPVNAELLEHTWGGIAGSRHPIPWGWFAIIALAITAAVVWSLNRVKEAEPTLSQIRDETVQTLTKAEEENQQSLELIERIHQTLVDFHNASSIETMAAFVRHQERVTLLMRQYYATHPITPKRLKSIHSLKPLTLDKHPNYWIAIVFLADGAEQRLILEILPSGEPRVDWETMVCYQPMSWDDFAAHRATGKSLEFRVYVETDHYYNHEFADSKRWSCFRLSVAGSETTIFGYAPIDGPLTQALRRQIFLNGTSKAPLILSLSIPENYQANRGVLIEKLLSTRWLYIESPAPAH